MGDVTILLSHGSLTEGAARALYQIAERLRAQRPEQVEVAFLNLAEPLFPEVLQRCVDHGARRVMVFPYFLSAGYYVRVDVPRAVEQARQAHPRIELAVSRPLLFSPLLADILVDNMQRGEDRRERDALLVMVHGSPIVESHADMWRVVELIRQQGQLAIVEAGFMELNQPDIPSALDRCAELGAERIFAVPYFLHTGSHVLDDLPQMLDDARRRHPAIAFSMGRYIGASPLLAQIIAERLAEF